jgi:hypothetical protein
MLCYAKLSCTSLRRASALCWPSELVCPALNRTGPRRVAILESTDQAMKRRDANSAEVLNRGCFYNMVVQEKGLNKSAGQAVDTL